ncbi:MAG: hypothetical protein KJ052_09140, partial [Candidatus Hydrogenedentes bacterium]|nr:hypothetical protein [Candidatus Hydrogenedentota bacterium]
MLFRRVLSHREKAGKLLKDSEEALAAGKLGKEQFASLRQFYEDQIAIGDATLTRLHEKEKTRLNRLDAELSGLRRQLEQVEREASGDDDARERAAQARRFLSEGIRNTEEQCEASRLLLDAQGSKELGGFIDLPLERYNEPPGKEQPGVSSVERLLAYVIPLIAGVAVFFPWLSYGGQARPLINIVPLFVDLGICGQPAPVSVRLFSIPYVLLPLLAVPWAALRDPWRGGWGLLTVGLWVLAAGLLPIAIVGTRASTVMSFGEVVAGLRVGQWLYCAAGLSLLVLGARALDRANPSIRAQWMGLVAVGGVTLALFLIAVNSIADQPGNTRVHFEALHEDSSAGTVELLCSNSGMTPISIYAPRPETGTTDGLNRNPQRWYAISLLVREAGDGPYKLLSSVETAWTAQDRIARSNEPYAVGPGVTLVLHLDGRLVRQVLPAARGMKIEIARGDGAIVFTHEMELPEQLAAPPTESILPQDATGTVSPPPQDSEARADSSAGLQSQVPDVVPPSAQVVVVLRGVIGNKAALEVRAAPGQPGEEGLFAEGAIVIGDWELQSVMQSPAAAILRNKNTGRRVSVARGG